MKVGCLVGNDGVDIWNRQRWLIEFDSYEVLVMTAGVFEIALRLSIIEFSQINLLIFDECHHTKKNHSYMNIMRRYNKDNKEKPRILGLTASIINQRITVQEFNKHVRQIENALQGTISG
ncbi:hypothetical protein GJ496_003214 [Pomphorhynchus laevis]|nr:hypothetical protein GJ496_003214 [Pomphorhynchus laevis]